MIINLIKKLIITSLVIFSCDNIIASENLKNSNISDNQQMQNTLPVQNNNPADIGNNALKKYLKDNDIDLKKIITCKLNNYEDFEKLFSDIKLNNPELGNIIITSNPMALLETVKDFDIELMDFVSFCLKTMMQASDIKCNIGLLFKVFIENDTKTEAEILSKYNDEITNNAEYYINKLLRDLGKGEDKKTIFKNEKNMCSAIDTIVEEYLYPKLEKIELLQFVTNMNIVLNLLKNKTIHAGLPIEDNSEKIKNMSQDKKDKLKNLLMDNFSFHMKNLDYNIKMFDDIIKSKKLDNLIFDIELPAKESYNYLCLIKQLADDIGLNTTALANDPAQKQYNKTTSEQK